MFSSEIRDLLSLLPNPGHHPLQLLERLCGTRHALSQVFYFSLISAHPPDFLFWGGFPLSRCFNSFFSSFPLFSFFFLTLPAATAFKGGGWTFGKGGKETKWSFYNFLFCYSGGRRKKGNDQFRKGPANHGNHHHS